MDSDDDGIPADNPGTNYSYDADIEPSFEDVPGSPHSTSESELSNAFIDEITHGHYQGWEEKHNRWLGRWVSDRCMKTLLYSMQSFGFLDLNTFLLKPMADLKLEIFARGTKLLDDFLAKAEIDIVMEEIKFPEGSYHFIDEVKWIKTFNGLYHALNYVQQPNADLLRFYELWVGAIVPAITKNPPETITCEKFEKSNNLSWRAPTYVMIGTDSSESDLEDESRIPPSKPVAIPDDLDMEGLDQRKSPEREL